MIKRTLGCVVLGAWLMAEWFVAGSSFRRGGILARKGSDDIWVVHGF